MECSQHLINTGEVELCYFEWGKRTSGQPTYILVHATGFHARCWDETIKYLGNSHVISIDQRGHGRSEKKGPFDWHVFDEDLTSFLKMLELDNLVGVGHSMGGHAMTVAASNLKGLFDRLVLIDPTIVDPEAYEGRKDMHAAWASETGEHPVAKRKNFFTNTEAMYQNLHGRGGYATWQDQVLHDYCEYGLLRNPEGEGFVLACPPKIEASIYMGTSGTSIYNLIPKIETPTVILRAKQRDPENLTMDFSTSPTWPELHASFQNARDVHFPELTHFIPMQAPEMTAEYILGTR